MRRLAAAIVVLVAIVLVGARATGPLPALGPLLEPAHGVWSLARSSVTERDARGAVPGLGANVEVVYDDRAVPHVFAASEADAYRALGYVVARDRLFQLYVQTMAASGRLTELAGARALPLDRQTRRLGLPRAAERKLAATPDSALAMRLATAYAAGVNAYVDDMPASAMPLEFRLLGIRPPRWSPIDSYHLLGRMGWILANISLERDRAAAAARVGAAAAAALFPDASPIQEPIQPNGATSARVDRLVLPPPGTPDSAATLATEALDALSPLAAADRARDDEEPRTMASNNWAVSPRRTAAGHALLSGDPHLDLSLPSIWYEAHLVVPGVLDAYGVTIPGAPAIVIGFNRDVAWTFTNTGADVMDLYDERVDDADRPSRYMLDGAWRALERRVEVYRDRAGRAIAADTLYFTHRGPMQHLGARWVSVRWTVLESGNELAGFASGAHARSAAELESSMSTYYMAPAQNMLAADRGGHIAIRSTGRFPIRPGNGSGGVVRDGSLSANDWTGALAPAQYPQSMDPAQGYLASANQQPVDPATTRAWWGGSYDPWRAMRINTLLRADSAVTPQAMQRYQTDPGSARADLFAPYFLDAARRVLARAGSSPDPGLADGARLLAQWNRRYTRDDTRAVLFEAAMSELVARTWDELRVRPQGAPRVATPSSAVLAAMLLDSSSVWWDDRGTPTVETRDDILAASLAAAMMSTRQRYGDPDGDGWRWEKIRHANINHLLQLRALSALDIPVQGGPETLSPSAGSGTHGASWRMVVELGDTVRAWVTYPGGQSGNPVSARYRDRLPLWTAGQLEPARVPASPDQLDASHRSAKLTLHPGVR